MRDMIFLILLLLNVTLAAKIHLDLAWLQGSIKNRSRRDISCREGQAYAHDSICCLNCPAGTYVKKACFSDLEKGVCEPCEFDTYTEHGNGLRMCLPCTKCRLVVVCCLCTFIPSVDQETTEKCTSTQNTHCKCKQGSFCLPDQACEVCKKCSKCKEDEEMVKSCTVSSNTVCRKRSSMGSSISVMICVVSILYWKWSKPSKTSITSRSPRKIVKINMGDRDEEREKRQNVHNSKMDESSQFQSFLEQNCVVGTLSPASLEMENDRGLGDSLPNTATSSQISVAMFAVPGDLQPSHANQPPCSALPWQPHTSDRESSRRLVPLNGEESLKKTFDLFEEMDVHYHNRFFRLIGLSDNVIKSTESLFPEDRVYELLKNWMEKEGMKADFNNLIEALTYLDQRLSAENIIAKAISNGYFKYEDE
ncbi:hematopoietic death receptor isoform X2 [Myxocyprinus asiaticus]|uniref:hematopoietic death receptor isoform X2 n=1 Tax=Myxocyprinus asiaticus TaxID=70543 RepID=UPI0022238693|nr:hematopoietic death receptor isoform X2 [Myxocyprinus asiaticus]